MIKSLTVLCFSLFMMGMAEGQTHLWGTCGQGGINFWGTIFNTDGNGNNLNTVYSFDSTNGRAPLGNLVIAPNGKIYGVTHDGGCADSCILFEYDPVTNIKIGRASCRERV